MSTHRIITLMAILARPVSRLFGPVGLLRRWPRLFTHIENVRGIAFTAQLYHPRRTQVHPTALINHRVVIHSPAAPVTLGPLSQVNFNTVILGGSGVKIGERVMIGPNCVLAAGNHDYQQTHTPLRFADAVSAGPIVIEDDAWLGAGVVITDGVTIGRGAVVGAGAVVTRDIPSMAIAAGVPARIVGYRGEKTADKAALAPAHLSSPNTEAA